MTVHTAMKRGIIKNPDERYSAISVTYNSSMSDHATSMENWEKHRKELLFEVYFQDSGRIDETTDKFACIINDLNEGRICQEEISERFKRDIGLNGVAYIASYK